MDRKTKILLSVLNKTDSNCLQFLNVPHYQGRGTTENERHAFIQEQHKILQNQNIMENNHITKTPEINVQIDCVSSTEKAYQRELRKVKRNLFEEETCIDNRQILKSQESAEVTSTIEQNENSDAGDYEVSSGSDYVPDSASDTSDSKIESDDSFPEMLDKACNERLNIMAAATTQHIESSTSIAEKSPNYFCIHKKDGEVRKGKKKADFCFYCETPVLNFARHIKRNHSFELDVQKILSCAPGSRERKRLLDLLRKRGNFLNSNYACKPVQSLRSAKKLLPCDNCLGFFSAKLLWRHRSKCVNSKSKNHQAIAQNMLVANLRIDSHLKNTVFPRMRADEISLVAKKDPLICAYGARYIKIHREKHFINVASRKMREIARLLIELKKMEPSINCFFDALKPKYFDTLVAATKTVAKYNTEKDRFDSPTYAINMGTYLKQCAEIAIVFALKRKEIAETVASAEAEADLKTIIKIIESQWQYEISCQAANDLNINKWNKVTLVPLASDLKVLKEFLISQANSAIRALDTDVDINQYIVLLETIFCRVILLNRRRPGELQRLKLDVYQISNNSISSSNYEEFSEVVSPTEKILLKRFKRIVIRGKRGRGVPVLFSPDIQEHIKILLHYRNKFVNERNLFLFGNPRSAEPICGYKVLKKYAMACGAKNPSAISATRLRKHLATLTQLFDMSENDLEQLANFMGHTIGVHRGNYRLPNDVYQTAKLSKILILMEKGEAAQFKGKSLNDINLNLEEDLLTDSMEDNPRKSPSPLPETLEPTTSKTSMQKDKHISHKNKRVLVKWTTEQRDIVTSFFENHIKTKKPPKRSECEELKSLYPEVFRNKDWPKIKVFVQNQYKKIK